MAFQEKRLKFVQEKQVRTWVTSFFELFFPFFPVGVGSETQTTLLILSIVTRDWWSKGNRGEKIWALFPFSSGKAR